MIIYMNSSSIASNVIPYNYQNILPLTVRIEVKDVTPHFPTVAADLAADGRLVFSLNKFSNWKVG